MFFNVYMPGWRSGSRFWSDKTKRWHELVPRTSPHLLASRIVSSRGLAREDFARGRGARAPSTPLCQPLLDSKLLCAFTTDQYEAHFAQVHNMSEAVLTMVHRFQDLCKTYSMYVCKTCAPPLTGVSRAGRC